jgi:hypothetical protein
MSAFPPEASWVTEMREHFHRYGFYRREDVERLLGKPGDCAVLDANGNVVLHDAPNQSETI